MTHQNSTLYPLLLSLCLISFGACGPAAEPKADSHTDAEVISQPASPPAIPIEEVLGHIDPARHDSFALIPRAITDRDGLYLRRPALVSLMAMVRAASEAGHDIVVKSATRPFHHQKRIWEDKWHGRRAVDGVRLDKAGLSDYERAKAILRWSSMPGTSRHHWGTDIDINAFENSYFESGPGLALYQWMQAHAGDYGYCQVYTDKALGRTGYEEEKWHWSYQPLADQFTAVAAHISEDSIRGFDGSHVAGALQVVTDYILGVDEHCLPAAMQ